MPDRPPSLLRLGGMLALLILVAPLGSLYRQYSLWYHRQEMKLLRSDPIVVQAAAAAAHSSRQQSGGEGASRTGDSTGSTTGTSSSSARAHVPPGGTNIGSCVINGEDVGDKISAEEEVLFSLLGVGFGRRNHHHQLMMQNLGLGFGGADRSSDITVGIHIIMPWLLALVLGVIVPAVLGLIGRVQNRRGRKYYDSLGRKEKRLFRLIQCFSRYKKDIEDGDLVGASTAKFTTKDDSAECCKDCDSSDECGDADDNTEDRLMLKIPHAGIPLLPVLSAAPNTLRQVPGTCTICIEQYKVGDTVVWSSNSSCRDHFHERCIISWLSKRRGGSDARCPCCRQHFIDDIFRAQAGLNSR